MRIAGVGQQFYVSFLSSKLIRGNSLTAITIIRDVFGHDWCACVCVYELVNGIGLSSTEVHSSMKMLKYL